MKNRKFRLGRTKATLVHSESIFEEEWMSCRTATDLFWRSFKSSKSDSYKSLAAVSSFLFFLCCLWFTVHWASLQILIKDEGLKVFSYTFSKLPCNDRRRQKLFWNCAPLSQITKAPEKRWNKEQSVHVSVGQGSIFYLQHVHLQSFIRLELYFDIILKWLYVDLN